MKFDSEVRATHLQSIRDRNRVLILEAILHNKGISRHELTKKTGLTHATVTRIVKQLIQEGLCYEGATHQRDNARGRKRVELHINPDGGYVVALCFSVFSRLAAITDISGERRFEMDLPAAAAPASVDAVGSWIDDLITNGKLSRERLLGAAIVIAGSVDHASGLVINAPLLGWQGIPLKDRLSDRLECPVTIENVADALCLACLDQYYLNSDSHIHMLLTHVAYGMGASLVIDGGLVRRRDDEGWIGRIPMMESLVTRECQTLNDVCSGRAILGSLNQDQKAERAVTNLIGVPAQIKEAVAKSNAGDQFVTKIFGQAGRALGRALVSITAGYLPNRIVLAGPIGSTEAYFHAARSAYEDLARRVDQSTAEIVLSRIRYIEAAENLALRNFFCQRDYADFN